jgi:hypothetical protein
VVWFVRQVVARDLRLAAVVMCGSARALGRHAWAARMGCGWLLW